MNEWKTAKELASLPGLPVTESGVIRLARRQNWEAQQRIGQGGGYEYHISNLPAEARKALEANQIEELMPRLHESNSTLSRTVSTQQAGLNERQRTTADARATVITAINAMHDQGISKESAIAALLAQAITGQLAEINPVLDKALQLAKDPRGNSASNYPSDRSIKRWFAAPAKDLAPKAKREIKIPEWANEFLLCWQRPEKPSVEHAYRQFTAFYEGTPPSIYAVRRFSKKIGRAHV